MTPDPAAPRLAPLLESVRGLDLTSADGRAGIRCLLAEIERLSPGAVQQQAAALQLRSLGCPPPSSSRTSPAARIRDAPTPGRG